jgi:hypothetical protein
MKDYTTELIRLLEQNLHRQSGYQYKICVDLRAKYISRTKLSSDESFQPAFILVLLAYFQLPHLSPLFGIVLIFENSSFSSHGFRAQLPGITISEIPSMQII